MLEVMADISSRWLQDARSEAADTISLFSNPRKGELERRTCAAFLRCLGIPFRCDQLESSKPEPPDVLFGSARFEITYIEEPGRKRHKEWREKLTKRDSATSLADLIEPYYPKKVLDGDELVQMVVARMKDKTQRYSARTGGCADLDLLIYINQNVLLSGPLKKPFQIPGDQNWRSVSLLIAPHSYVLYTTKAAPKFLRKLTGTPKTEWQQPFETGMFDLE